ncbi:DUF4279 domain-containing protein [Streptomyces sp. S3(2020)]|uniref:DUF4279 domain-containing protein n=1 Tax=Streptomyces sp. S3(2020) TaxID=2732044 RepID=UPI001487FA4F|nr:DUF4279 domain-containing protein [Streptomyces sp. S3(2020)]NNN37974.1 DUF4279 domain-containing protein [Streptomyces sp. S3(2020)]
MQYDYTEGAWVETDVKLLVRKSDLDPDLLARELPLTPTAVSLPTDGSRSLGLPDEGVWSLAVHKRLPGGIDDQLRELLRQITPHASSISSLAARGYEVSINVSGFVGRGSTFSLAPDVISQVAALNIPFVVSPSTSER